MKREILVVVDMQNDFVTGVLGTPEAVAIVPKINQKIKDSRGKVKVVLTKDTHEKNYLSTLEGKNLPVQHCIEGTEGHNFADIGSKPSDTVITKNTFGSLRLAQYVNSFYKNGPDKITLIGVCTDICVISNAMILKSTFPETLIVVDASLCAGVTPESHKRALEAMKMCQIVIENE